ncbi:hypothetical protein [Corynebacterium sp.]|uniref:hypothetical protein n=1 Tax=Corynebacterium sp. TaxID=1720 RepID=UPI0028AAF1F2|nr:hypothetical protein [Corynebacterium sp.]
MTTSIVPAIVGRITVDDQDLIIERREYTHGGSIALLVFDVQTGEFYSDLSVNLPDAPTAPGAFWVKGETMVNTLGNALVESRIIRTTGMFTTYGSFGSVASECVLNTTRVSIRIESHYADGTSSARTEIVPVVIDTIPDAAAHAAAVESWISTEFLPLTGDGRDPSIHATYHVEVTGIEDRAHLHLVGATFTAEG